MTLIIFVSILVLSATATSFAIDIIKKLLDQLKVTYHSLPVAAVTAFVTGIAELFLYYMTNGLPIRPVTFLYAVCMGIANAVGSIVGYDTVKRFLLALAGKTE